MSRSSSPSPAASDRESTRDALLDAAFDQMYLKGYQASGINEILEASDLTKGALYHHFGSKLELGHAVVEERVLPLVRERYLRPFKQTSDPIVAMERMGARMEQELLNDGILARGCPLNNLVQEMSAVDEGFRRRLETILHEWRDTIADGLKRGQAEGMIDPDVDPDSAATFVIASLLGGVGFAKNARDVGPFDACRRAVNAYAATLRPEAAAAS